MHGDLIVRGWFLWLVYVAAIVLLAGAVAVLVGALRRPASDFGRLGRWPWVLLQGIFLSMGVFTLAADLLRFGSGVPAWFATALGIVVVLAGIQQVAYLLRVVYPAPKRASSEADAGAEAPEWDGAP